MVKVYEHANVFDHNRGEDTKVINETGRSYGSDCRKACCLIDLETKTVAEIIPWDFF